MCVVSSAIISTDASELSSSQIRLRVHARMTCRYFPTIPKVTDEGPNALGLRSVDLRVRQLRFRSSADPTIGPARRGGVDALVARDQAHFLFRLARHAPATDPGRAPIKRNDRVPG